MKYINIEQLQLLPNWQTRANKALAKAIQKTDSKEKMKYIENRSDLWRDLAPNLRSLSNQKCWYCGKKISPNSPVDHFRPKGKPDECKHHGGYWWLAFNWRNYRISCNECNTGSIDYGKLSHFPLLDVDCDRCVIDQCVRPFTHVQTYEREHPVLLDPTNKDDPPLIYYCPDGKIECSTKKRKDKTRVTKSRNIYYWDSSNSDRGVIFVSIQRSIKVINLLLPQKDAPPIAKAIAELKSAVLDLVGSNAPFDVAAKQYLSEFLVIYPELEEIFT